MEQAAGLCPWFVRKQANANHHCPNPLPWEESYTTPPRGAHVGHLVRAFALVDGSGIFPDTLHGSVEVDDCGPGALVLALSRIALPFLIRLEPIGPGETRVFIDVADRASRPAMARVRVGGGDPISIAIPSAARGADASLRGRLSGLPERGITDLEIGVVDDEGREIAVRTTSSFASLREGDALDVTSADGRLELSLPAGALEAPAELVIETAVGLPPPPDRSAFVCDAYRLASSRGDPLLVKAMLEVNLDVNADDKLRNRKDLLYPTLVQLRPDGRGSEDVQVQQRSDRFVGARIDRLGTYALAARTPEVRVADVP